MKNSKPYIKIDMAKIPKDFDIERVVTIFNTQGIQMIDSDIKYELEDCTVVLKNPFKLHVSKDVIDFLDIHNVLIEDDIKYFIINKTKYKYNGKIKTNEE